MNPIPPFKGFPIMNDYGQCEAPKMNYQEKTTVNVEGSLLLLSQRVEELSWRVDRLERDTSPVLPDLFDFGQALGLLKVGRHLTRKCWRNREIKIFLYKSERIDCMDEIRVRTATGKAAPWAPNHSELLADDWMIANG
jgi:Protein of unknown function (DUF2829)